MKSLRGATYHHLGEQECSMDSPPTYIRTEQSEYFILKNAVILDGKYHPRKNKLHHKSVLQQLVFENNQIKTVG